ncbi:MAG: hypothetical protein GVY30_08545 [Chloroflexi bacterium]|jgi:NAD-dependent dihydropyrimidine dehydrogenase PreA subunit|nr:hypothetical protein [Chloroflexota bacterium]
MALSYRQIVIDGSPTGVQGLDEIFAQLYEAGRRPGEAELGAEIVGRAAEHNYIPPGAREVFAQALLAEYTTYVARRAKGEADGPVDYGTWRGYPRESIPWFPTVDLDLCDGCGVCLRLCSHHALAPIEAGDGDEAGKVRVAEPFHCVVGCSSCANVCKPKAITFPPRSMLDAYRLR